MAGKYLKKRYKENTLDIQQLLNAFINLFLLCYQNGYDVNILFFYLECFTDGVIFCFYLSLLTSFSCIFNTICTVTGSTVIDFVGSVHSVPDRCGYTLMRPLSIPGFQVLGVFQERRRKDMSFLDRVILQLDGAGVQISLEQGRRVQVSYQLPQQLQ